MNKKLLITGLSVGAGAIVLAGGIVGAVKKFKKPQSENDIFGNFANEDGSWGIMNKKVNQKGKGAADFEKNFKPYTDEDFEDFEDFDEEDFDDFDEDDFEDDFDEDDFYKDDDFAKEDFDDFEEEDFEDFDDFEEEDFSDFDEDDFEEEDFPEDDFDEPKFSVEFDPFAGSDKESILKEVHNILNRYKNVTPQLKKVCERLSNSKEVTKANVVKGLEILTNYIKQA